MNWSQLADMLPTRRPLWVGDYGRARCDRPPDCRGSPGMLRQPWDIGDAFRRRAGLRTADASRVVPVRRCSDRRCRRLRPDRRQTGGHAAAPGTGNGERVGEPAQRPSGVQPCRQHRRRPRHLSPEARCATAIRHRGARRLAGGNGAPTRVGRGPGRCGRHGDCQRDIVAACRHAHPSRGPVVERVGIGWRQRTTVRRAGTGGRRHHRRRECAEIAWRTYGPVARRACDHRRGVACGGAHLRCDRRQGARGDLPCPARARPRRARYPTLGLLRRAGAGTAQGDNAFDAGRSAVTGDVLRVSEHGE